jgi:trehalose 6-phosphate synthase/phosphatase
MSSLRNHRVIIASLFLPNTAVVGESNPPTPDIYAREVGIGNTQDSGSRPPAFRHTSTRSIGSTPAPLKSIVDDLKVSEHTGNYNPLLQFTPSLVPSHYPKRYSSLRESQPIL